jgi:hypothetical protein
VALISSSRCQISQVHPNPDLFASVSLTLFLPGLLYITALKGSTSPSCNLYAVECWIVLSFCLGGVCSGQVTNSESGESYEMTFAGYKASAIGRVIQFILWAAMVYYAIWFLYTGMDQMVATPCSRHAFFFTQVVRDPVRFLLLSSLTICLSRICSIGSERSSKCFSQWLPYYLACRSSFPVSPSSLSSRLNRASKRSSHSRIPLMRSNIPSTSASHSRSSSSSCRRSSS